MPKQKLVIEIECEDTKTLDILTKLKTDDVTIKAFTVETIKPDKKVGFAT